MDDAVHIIEIHEASQDGHGHHADDLEWDSPRVTVDVVE